MAGALSLQISAVAGLAAGEVREGVRRPCVASVRPLNEAPSRGVSISASSSAPGPVARSVAARVAVDPTSAEAAQQSATRYHFVVANAKFMLDEEEHFQEQLKERLRWLKEQGREQDFWLLYEPAFLDSFPEITKRLNRPAVALVSTDATWIVFMKIRLDRVLMGEYEADTPEDGLKAKQVDVEFQNTGKWVAPYTKYPKDWWKPYVPQ